MKKLKFVIRTILTIFLFSLFIYSCSGGDNELTDSTNSVYNIKTINNYQNKGNKLTKSDFEFNLNKEKREDNFVTGKIKYKEIGDINVKMYLTENHLEGISVNRIDDKNLDIKNLNGRDYHIKVNQLDKDNAVLSFKVDDESFDISVSGEIDVDDFYNLNSNSNNTSAKQMFVCGGACIAAVVTVATGAYCAWRETNAANNCTEAYVAAVSAGGNCSMEFESGYCGGDCNINCGPANN